MANTDQNGQSGANWDLWFLRKQITDQAKNEEFHHGIAVSWVSRKCPGVATSSFSGEIQEVFYGSDVARMLKGLLAELLIGSVG